MTRHIPRLAGTCLAVVLAVSCTATNPDDFAVDADPPATDQRSPDPSPRTETDDDPHTDPAYDDDPPRDDVVRGQRGDSLNLREGQSATVDDLRITVVSAEGVPDDCNDCPARTTIDVTDGSATERLSFSFSGLMPEDTLEERRTREVFGRTIRIDAIVQGEVDLTVS